MGAKVFVDTNVLVYAYDRSEPEKQRQALATLDRLVTARAGVIGPQVMSEFFVAVTRKIAAPLSVAEAYQRLANYLQIWTITELTGLIVLEAARGVRDHQFSFWDAQIWATARLNQISIIFSEDFNAGAIVEGVRFVNPFAEAFKVEDWV
ncbi:MAG: PIN domain-containing protein [Chloroflexota bacterium]